jgi:hypothetical protein
MMTIWYKREVSATSGPRFNTERKTIISSPAAAGDFDATEEQQEHGAQLSLREFDGLMRRPGGSLVVVLV